MDVLVEDKARGVIIEAKVEGEGPDVVLLASALRGADDYAQLQQDLAAAGFRSIALNMRGIGRSSGPTEGLTLRDLADDVAAVITQLCGGKAHVVGHALGNIIARGTASYRPEAVRSVTVMPCGGHELGRFPLAPEVLTAFQRCHQSELSDEERKQALSIAFFAPGNDPSSWLGGWYPAGGAVSAAAVGADTEEWWRAGEAPMLILHPMQDAMAPPAAGRAARDAFGARARYQEISNCGHAILPEQPELIAEAIVSFLRHQG